MASKRLHRYGDYDDTVGLGLFGVVEPSKTIFVSVKIHKYYQHW